MANIGRWTSLGVLGRADRRRRAASSVGGMRRSRWASDRQSARSAVGAERLAARRCMHRPDDVAAIGERRCRRCERGGYPRSVTSPTRAPRRAARRRRRRTAGSRRDPDAQRARRPAPRGWRPGRRPRRDPRPARAAVDEAARLLDADGAMVYLVDPATGHLRFAHDAGIRSRRSRAWVRSIDLPVGVGIFGRAVAERAVVRDQRLPGRRRVHSRTRDRSRGRRHRDPLDGRGAAGRRRHGLRRAGHVLLARRRVQPGPDRARPRAGRPRRRRDAQRRPHRGARRVAHGARQAGRRRAVAARDRGADQRRRRLPGRPPARGRRGSPAVRRRRRPDRPHRPGDRPARSAPTRRARSTRASGSRSTPRTGHSTTASPARRS